MESAKNLIAHKILPLGQHKNRKRKRKHRKISTATEYRRVTRSQ